MVKVLVPYEVPIAATKYGKTAMQDNIAVKSNMKIIVKSQIHDLRNRPLTVLTTGKDGKKVNVANTDRLTKELEKFQGLDEELALLQVSS